MILYRSQGVKLELGGLRFILGLAWCIWCWGFLFYIDFHFMLDSRQGLGFNLCTMLKYTLKSSPCSYFSTVRLGGLDFTQMYTYRILSFWNGILWILMEFGRKIIEKRINKNIRKHLKTNTEGSCIQLGSCAKQYDQATICSETAPPPRSNSRALKDGKLSASKLRPKSLPNVECRPFFYLKFHTN